jgi:hypothetical protein
MNSVHEETDILEEYLKGFLLVKSEIFQAIADEDWQDFRLSLKGKSTEKKLEELRRWLKTKSTTNGVGWKAKVQVMNYINALKRGGQLSTSGQIQR